jgi:sentrin-specific protease 8
MSSVLHPFGGRISRHFGESVSFRNYYPTLLFSKSLIPSKQLAPEDAYLSYHDVRLTKLDIDCIKHDWFTDNAIAFWEEWLEREKLRNYPRADIVLLRPSMTFMLMRSPDPTSLKSALPNFSKTTHIFLPVNNAKNVDVPEAGSHWSLLVVSVIDGVSFHYDSLGGDNRHEAQIASGKLSQLLRKPLRFAQMHDVPQQENGSDCGVYVCLFMRKLLLERLLRADAGQKISMSLRNEPFNARKGRKLIMEIIDDFRREGEKRRSRSASPYRAKSPPRIGDEQGP